MIALSLVSWTLRSPILDRLYQTLPLLIFAYVVHFGAQAMRASQVAVDGVPRRVDDAARALGAGRWRRFRTIDLPIMLPGLAAGGGLVLLSVMKELPDDAAPRADRRRDARAADLERGRGRLLRPGGDRRARARRPLRGPHLAAHHPAHGDACTHEPAPRRCSAVLTLPRLIALVVLFVAAWTAPLAAVPATYGAQTTADEPQYLMSAISLGEDRNLDVRDERAEGRYRDFHRARPPDAGGHRAPTAAG